MIKKSLIVILLAIGCAINLFAGAFSETNKFSIDSVNDIDISLMFENLYVSLWKGNEIVITSESNNKSMIPEVVLNDKNLQIKNNDYEYENKYFCDVSLMLPEKFVADKIAINAPYKKLVIKKLIARTVSLIPGPDNYLADIKVDYFEIPIPDEADINISNLDCKAFKISLVAGNLNLSLAHTPENESSASVKHGNINLEISETEKFTLKVTSYNSKFYNEFTSEKVDWVRDGITYKHNGGGPEITLHTFTGDIRAGEVLYASTP